MSLMTMKILGVIPASEIPRITRKRKTKAQKEEPEEQLRLTLRPSEPKSTEPKQQEK